MQYILPICKKKFLYYWSKIFSNSVHCGLEWCHHHLDVFLQHDFKQYRKVELARGCRSVSIFCNWMGKLGRRWGVRGKLEFCQLWMGKSSHFGVPWCMTKWVIKCDTASWLTLVNHHIRLVKTNWKFLSSVRQKLIFWFRPGIKTELTTTTWFQK